MSKALPPFFKVDFTCVSTSPRPGELWYFDVKDETAMLLHHIKHDYFIERVAKIKAIDDSLYIKYDDCNYELAGPKSQREFKMWLATKILEEEVFDEN